MFKDTIRRVFLHFGPWKFLRWMGKKLYGPGITILYGHRVLPDELMSNPDDPRYASGHLSISDLSNAIESLQPLYRFITIDQAIEQIHAKKIEQESVVLSFDDGFNDNFNYLLPVLKRFNVPAVLYISPSVIGTERSLWFQAIINYFFSIKEETVSLAISNTQYDLSSSKKRYEAAFSLMQYLQKNKSPQAFNDIIEQLAGEQCLPQEADRHLSWSELEALTKEPLITIGAHSQNHFPLGYCSEELSFLEITQSITQLRERLGISVRHFSYPRGHQSDFCDYHKSLLQKQGIISSVSTLRGVNRGGEDDYCLKRVGIPQNASLKPDEFIWQVAGMPQFIEKFKLPEKRVSP